MNDTTSTDEQLPERYAQQRANVAASYEEYVKWKRATEGHFPSRDPLIEYGINGERIY